MEIHGEALFRHELGAHLRRLRHERGERLTDTADRAGISPQYLSEIERGLKDPSSEMLAAVAGALETEWARCWSRWGCTCVVHARRCAWARSARARRPARRSRRTRPGPACSRSRPDPITPPRSPRRSARSRARPSAVKTRSWSVSARRCSAVWPVCRDRTRSISRAHADHLVGLQDQVGDRAAPLRRRLVQHHAGVRQRGALARRARRQQHARPRRRPARRRSSRRRADVPHGVVDREHRARVAALAVDVELDLALGVVRRRGCSSCATSALATPASIAVPR